MKWVTVLLGLLLSLLTAIVIYGLLIGGVIGFLYLLMGVFNLGC